MLPLTDEIKSYSSQKFCHFCKKKFPDVDGSHDDNDDSHDDNND